MIDKQVRGIDEDLWQTMKIDAIRKKITLGELINKILSDYYKKNK